MEKYSSVSSVIERMKERLKEDRKLKKRIKDDDTTMSCISRGITMSHILEFEREVKGIYKKFKFSSKGRKQAFEFDEERLIWLGSTKSRWKEVLSIAIEILDYVIERGSHITVLRALFFASDYRSKWKELLEEEVEKLIKFSEKNNLGISTSDALSIVATHGKSWAPMMQTKLKHSSTVPATMRNHA